MSLDNKLLEILCCPVSKTPLVPISSQMLGRINDSIAAGNLAYVDGQPVTEALTEALITEDGKVVYPVRDGIPVLLPEQGIGTTQLETG